MTAEPRVLSGRYRVDELIGRGGMATVFRGYDLTLGRQVAIKVRTELSVTRTEHDAMARVLDGCEAAPLLTSDDVSWPAPAH